MIVSLLKLISSCKGYGYGGEILWIPVQPNYNLYQILTDGVWSHGASPNLTINSYNNTVLGKNITNNEVAIHDIVVMPCVIAVCTSTTCTVWNSYCDQNNTIHYTGYWLPIIIAYIIHEMSMCITLHHVKLVSCFITTIIQSLGPEIVQHNNNYSYYC